MTAHHIKSMSTPCICMKWIWCEYTGVGRSQSYPTACPQWEPHSESYDWPNPFWSDGMVWCCGNWQYDYQPWLKAFKQLVLVNDTPSPVHTYSKSSLYVYKVFQRRLQWLKVIRMQPYPNICSLGPESGFPRCRSRSRCGSYDWDPPHTSYSYQVYFICI